MTDVKVFGKLWRYFPGGQIIIVFILKGSILDWAMLWSQQCLINNSWCYCCTWAFNKKKKKSLIRKRDGVTYCEIKVTQQPSVRRPGEEELLLLYQALTFSFGHFSFWPLPLSLLSLTSVQLTAHSLNLSPFPFSPKLAFILSHFFYFCVY